MFAREFTCTEHSRLKQTYKFIGILSIIITKPYEFIGILSITITKLQGA